MSRGALIRIKQIFGPDGDTAVQHAQRGVFAGHREARKKPALPVICDGGFATGDSRSRI